MNALRILSWSAFIFAVAAFIPLFLHVGWVVAVFMLIIFWLSNVRAPIFSDAMNRLIHSRSRATTLSNLNVFKSVLDIPLMFLAGTLAHFGTATPLWICVALALAVLIVFPIRSKHVT